MSDKNPFKANVTVNINAISAIRIYIYIYMNYSKQKLCIGRNRLYDHMCGRYTNSTTNVLSVWVEGVYVIFIY